MLARVVQKADHVVVVERVVCEPTCSAHPDQTRAAKQTKLVRNCGLGHADQGGEIADAAFTMGQRIEEANASGIPEKLEDLGYGCHGSRAQEARPGVLERDGIRLVRGAARQISISVSRGIRRDHVI